jgi:hypothetical protein
MSTNDESKAAKDAAPDAPPSYAVATGSSTKTSSDRPNTLEVPLNPVASRKSMEDEVRPLPHGWIRQWDTTEQHQYFVDTNADPPRSIWVHPMDDEETWKALPAEEKERLQALEEEMSHIPASPSGKHSSTAKSDLPPEHYPQELPPRPGHADHAQSYQSSQQPGQSQHKKGFGERLKNKVTGMTHEEREAERAHRAEEERQYYEMHAKFRAALQRAQMTGQPQFFAKDKDGRDIFVEPPAPPGYGARGYGGGYGGYGANGYGYNPYTSGPYSNPNARYIRPNYAYGRPGYGGGLALPLAGGLLGGALLGGLLF